MQGMVVVGRIKATRRAATRGEVERLKGKNPKKNKIKKKLELLSQQVLIGPLRWSALRCLFDSAGPPAVVMQPHK